MSISNGPLQLGIWNFLGDGSYTYQQSLYETLFCMLKTTNIVMVWYYEIQSENLMLCECYVLRKASELHYY
jgi:hypothetical protein